MEPFPSFGGAAFSPHSKKVIRLILRGCVNRPFFHISVQEAKKVAYEPVIEQIGNYDPLPNEHNEKLVAINFQRLEYWLRQGANPSIGVRKLLGISGYLPVHPQSLIDAYTKRQELSNIIKELKIKAAKFAPNVEETPEKSTKESSSETSENISSKE